MSILPFELEREIFELTVRSNHGNAVLKLNLSLVARRVQIWSEKISIFPHTSQTVHRRVDLVYYELVTISESIYSSVCADNFLKLIDAKKPPDFFATAVKTLCIPYFVPAAEARRILSACTGVEKLAFWVEHFEPQLEPPLFTQLSLRRLSIAFRQLSDMITATIPSQSSWLSSITHVDLAFRGDVRTSDLADLSRLPRLSHVAFISSHTSPAHAEVLCSSCPSLQVLVVLYDDDSTASRAEMAALYAFDYRIVAAADEPLDVTVDWEASHFGHPDMWSLAEDVVAQRRATFTH
ncbi:hypothetical protein C8R44DRAFT_11848 [Mycena epipterygia]|nr:hypothetical protein C8R44DRAFT_11848 [Mycena epipterygia]